MSKQLQIRNSTAVSEFFSVTEREGNYREFFGCSNRRQSARLSPSSIFDRFELPTLPFDDEANDKS